MTLTRGRGALCVCPKTTPLEITNTKNAQQIVRRMPHPPGKDSTNLIVRFGRTAASSASYRCPRGLVWNCAGARLSGILLRAGKDQSNVGIAQILMFFCHEVKSAFL